MQRRGRFRGQAGIWTGERAATDILVLARKGRAFASLDTLIARQGGKHVLYGSALTLAGTIQAWAAQTDTPISELVRKLCAEHRYHSQISHPAATMPGIRRANAGRSWASVATPGG